MRTEEKTNVKNSIGRALFAAVCILIQLVWLYILAARLNEWSAVISALTAVLALVVALKIYGGQENAAFKMPWIILILASPVLGMFLFCLFGHKDVTKRMRRRFEKIDPKLLAEIAQDPAAAEELEDFDRAVANQCRYIRAQSGYPVYHNTDLAFFPDAAQGFEAQLAELARAEKFIFMEYHAIEEGAAFARLKAVLADRAAHGVEVRVLYDDVGSIGFIDPGFIKRMGSIGVQCRMFNPVVPALNFFMNNRDHRKITVIDGKVGFTGGYNLADEYFNLTHPYGHWKDTGVMLRGEGVEALTVMFLEMWNAMGETDADYDPYFCREPYRPQEAGFLQLYADSPLDNIPLGEDVYLNLIASARESLYIATPYLILSDEMTRALCLCARRGVDVRLVIPGIPDKKLIYQFSRAYCVPLAAAGVRVYEYTPGFLHQKQVLCDGKTATVGTINFDFRSLYHHFENGCLFTGFRAVKEVEKDFLSLFAASREVTEERRAVRSKPLTILQCLLRLFAPLL